MKASILKTVVVAGLAILTVPSAFAQDNKDDKDVQQIIITKKGNPDEKTVIEITGNTVTVNGKDAKDVKDVSVQFNKFRDFSALARINDRTWNFDMGDDHFSFFSADSNRAMLGVVTDSHDKGARVTSVTKESAAEKAGLKRGDIITKIGDQKIGDASDVSTAIRATKPGQKVDITVIRDDKEQKLKAEMGKWKGVQINAIGNNTMRPLLAPGAPSAPGAQGFSIYAPSTRPRLGLSIQDTEIGKGVKVLEVETDGAAGKAGLKKDDIITHFNDKEVNTTDEVTRLMRENANKASYSIRALRNGKTQNFNVVIPRKLKTANL
jgi:serine protease Do